MLARLREILARRRRLIAAGVLAFGLYCAAVEMSLPRNDPWRDGTGTVVVLSSGVQKNGALDRNGGARLRAAIAIAKAHDARLITTRVRRRKPPLLVSDSAQRVLVDSADYHAHWTILEGFALSTHDEAERLLRTLRIQPIAVVTSALHTRRACATFERLGYAVTCVSSGRETPWWKAPYFVLYESAALLEYRLRGWIS